MRRLLLGLVLLVLPLTYGAQPSVAGFVTDCYFLAVEFPPYAPEARLCPFPLPPIHGA